MFELYRAHSTLDLNGKTGRFANPYLKLDRRPRDSSATLHEWWGEWFKDKFGINFRAKALFCTGNRSLSESYVDPNHRIIAIDPVENFSICYSNKCEDLYAHFEVECSSSCSTKADVFSELDSLGYVFYTNGGLQAASESKNEIMIFAEYFGYSMV